jgi:NADP-dependent 3-hydroxy acid dehydrogenase YdfG
VVTGSSGGIGEEIARRLATEDAAVMVHGRRAEAVQAVADDIRSSGGQIFHLPTPSLTSN